MCVCARARVCVVLSHSCFVVSVVACLIVLLMLAASYSYHFAWHVGRHIIGGEKEKCVGNTAHSCMFVF